MHDVTPEVFLIAKPQTVESEISRYLEHVGVSDNTIDKWSLKSQFDPFQGEVLSEFMGRLCYRSWEPGLNANVTKVREDGSDYIRNIVKQMHGTVPASATYSFVFSNVSRVFTHELLRHQAGANPTDGGDTATKEVLSQESLRYVRLDDLGMWLPDWCDSEDRDIVAHAIYECEVAIDYLYRKYRLDDPGVSFDVKKRVTSMIRRIAPQGMATEIGWSANIRTIRFCVEQRTSRHAEEEIRMVFNEVGMIMEAETPNAFADYVKTPFEGINEWTTEYSKI